MKLDQSKKAKQEYINNNQALINCIPQDKFITREELCEIWQCNDSQARMVVAEMAMYIPIISGTSLKGYRRARNLDELSQEELQKEIAQIEISINDKLSRIAPLKARCKALYAYKSIANKRIKPNET